MPTLVSSKDFQNKILAGSPLIYVKTYEEYRVLTQYSHQLSTLQKNKYALATWDSAEGLRRVEFIDGTLRSSDPEPDSAVNPGFPLGWLEKAQNNTIVFLKDYHVFLNQATFSESHTVVRKIRDLLTRFKSIGKSMVILSPTLQLPMELDKDALVIDFELPGRDELKVVLNGVHASIKEEHPEVPALTPEHEDALILAALGMTAMEAENAYAVSFIEARRFDETIVRREKSAVVKKTGILQVVNTLDSLEDVGGSENLKDWLIERKRASTAAARKFGVKSPRGLLLMGSPGCGKSMIAKIVGNVWNRPVYRLDLGSVFGSYVGESEKNMNRVWALAKASAPCVLWIDEIEKGVSGNKAGNDSHETTRRVFQILLTEMAEGTAEVFVVATANSVASIPPELLRAGRINQMFWVDLPDAVQRAEIFRIHLKRIGRKPNLFDSKMKDIVKACEGFSGAEIEVWISDAVLKAFTRDHTEIQYEDLLDTVGGITPISKLMATEIDEARQWAKRRGTPNASITHDEPAVTQVAAPKRKISVQPSEGSLN